MTTPAAYAAFGAPAEVPSLARVRHDWMDVVRDVEQVSGLSGLELRNVGPVPTQVDADGLVHLNAYTPVFAGELVGLSIDLDLAAALTRRYGTTMHVRVIAVGNLLRHP